MEYGAVLHSPYYTLPEGMKFTLVVFSCKQYVDVVAARSSHSTRTVYNIALEPGTGTGLREIDVRGQRSSVPPYIFNGASLQLWNDCVYVLSCFLVFLLS